MRRTSAATPGRAESLQIRKRQGKRRTVEGHRQCSILDGFMVVSYQIASSCIRYFAPRLPEWGRVKLECGIGGRSGELYSVIYGLSRDVEKSVKMNECEKSGKGKRAT
jgi:hypothetical protein